MTPTSALSFLQAFEANKLNPQASARSRYLLHEASGLLANGVLVVGEDAEVEDSREGAEAQKLATRIGLPEAQLSYQPTFSLFIQPTRT